MCTAEINDSGGTRGGGVAPPVQGVGEMGGGGETVGGEWPLIKSQRGQRTTVWFRLHCTTRDRHCTTCTLPTCLALYLFSSSLEAGHGTAHTQVLIGHYIYERNDRPNGRGEPGAQAPRCE